MKDHKAKLQELKNKSLQAGTENQGKPNDTELPAPGEEKNTEVKPLEKRQDPPVVKPSAVIKPEEDPEVHAVIVQRMSSQIDIPGKLKRVIVKEDDLNFDKTNISISRDVVHEFNMLKQMASQKRFKTSANNMMSNILREWLAKNSEDLQKSFGYKPFGNG